MGGFRNIRPRREWFFPVLSLPHKPTLTTFLNATVSSHAYHITLTQHKSHLFLLLSHLHLSFLFFSFLSLPHQIEREREREATAIWRWQVIASIPWDWELWPWLPFSFLLFPCLLLFRLKQQPLPSPLPATVLF